MKRKVIILLVATLIMNLLAIGTGCTNQNDLEEPGDEKQDGQVETGGSEKSDDEQEAYTVKMIVAGNATSEICKEVSEAASKITQEKYNTTIELTRPSYGSFEQELTLALSSDEKLDLIPNFAFDVITGANNGQIIDLDGLLAEYGKDILSTVSEEDFRCTTINGKIFAVPNSKETAMGHGFAMRKDMLEAVNYDISTIKSEADLGPLFEAIKEAYPQTYPFVSDNGNMGEIMVEYDALGDNLGVLINCADENNTTVVNKYETQEFIDSVNLRYKWANEGLILPDASTGTEDAFSIIAAGKGFGYYANIKPGIEGEWTRKVGQDMTVVQISKAYSTTSGVANSWCIPYTSEKPERAMQVLNEIYSNPELANILIYGIEGKTFELIDEENGVIGYPEGVDASNTAYSSDPWQWPNELISYTWEIDGKDIWKATLAFNQEAVQSVAKGFTWDNTNVINEVTSSQNVCDKYVKALMAGSIEPENGIAQLNQELKAAGIDKIIAEKQEQLNKWLAGN